MCLYVHESIPCFYISMSPFHVSKCPRVHVMYLYVHGYMSYVSICVFLSIGPCNVSICPNIYITYMCVHISLCIPRWCCRKSPGWYLRLSHLWAGAAPLTAGVPPGPGAGAAGQGLPPQSRPRAPQVCHQPRPRPGTEEQMGCKSQILIEILLWNEVQH